MATGRRLTGLLFLAFFLHGVMLNGVVLTNVLSESGLDDNTPSIVTIDVCGNGASPAASQHLDLKACFPAPPIIHLSFEHVFPPNPDEAVASAPPGEIDRPPQS